MLKLKDNVSLKELEKYGFEKDDHCPNSYYYNKGIRELDYCYKFLRVDIHTKEIFISSGVDEVCGDEELSVFYDLVKDNLVEKK